jgi:hypothetical protein
MAFDVKKLSPLWRRGVKISPYQVRLDLSVLGKEWRGVLEGLLSA